jgi:hypothetical protein
MSISIHSPHQCNEAIFRISLMSFRIYARDHFGAAQRHQTMRRRKADISSRIDYIDQCEITGSEEAANNDQ